MKEVYESPAMEIVRFDCEDVITTSGDPSINPGENETDFFG
jgi:hypothetical protein